MRKERNYRTSVSGISVLMVFLILCIAIFAVLTLSAAQNEWHLTERNETQVNNYYACDSLAQQQLAELHTAVQQGGVGALDGAAYRVHGSNVIFETAQVGNRKMYVEVEVRESNLRIIEYRLINTDMNDYDDGTLEVLQ